MSKSLNLGAIASQGGGISSRNTVSESFNTDANKNHLFFGPVVFQETVTITQDSNLILLKASPNFKKTVNIKGTLNWIT